MVYRVFVEKKPAFAHEAEALLREANAFLGVTSLQRVRVLNRYDAENLDRALFDRAVKTVFSEPQVDLVFDEADVSDASAVFAVEYLPGQFDQRADSAAQCIQLLSQGERPLVRSAKVYALYGALTRGEIDTIKRYVINPVEAREAAAELPKTLRTDYAVPTEVQTLDGFIALDREGLSRLMLKLGLAMDADDVAFCQAYFRLEKRDPTITELRMIDTYWSDHCRHTTFLTEIDSVSFEDERLQAAYRRYLSVRERLGRADRPICLMDLATIAAKHLRAEGKLDRLDESEEINACTVKIDVEIDGKTEPWLLLFKNETHNHPTEIEPFGGAATCIGGAIRDPLSGRAYVYGAMRLTGAADPTVPVSKTLPGKLPQRKIVTTAAAGYSSYGNQIGLATGIVDEVYHPGYAAKRMEIGAVIAAAPQSSVRRERPAAGDVVILLGGATGRDGIGGATGSSKAHTEQSVAACGAEVQKGNAPEERKLQRLFRNPNATRLIKRCNDFGAGGVSVAIGELADGLLIDLNAVPKKYEGLDGTELAISESQERMAVVVDAADRDAFLRLAHEENLQATPVAVVTDEPRLVMEWNGKRIVDVSRAFLNSNGAKKHISVAPAAPHLERPPVPCGFTESCKRIAADLNVCSKQGLSERFDATIGAGTVLMPFGGRRQKTPAQAMVQKVSVEHGHTDTCSLMAWGFDPALSEKSPYHGAYGAVVESVSKLIAAGAAFTDVYLTFQEYFEKPGRDPKRWGKPFAALLGAFDAQMDLGIGAIGGKDSMSGSFESFDVPPTLVSFAVTTEREAHIVSNECKAAGHPLLLLSPAYDGDGLPKPASLLALYARVTELLRQRKAIACHTPERGGALAAVLKMAMGNGLGVCFSDAVPVSELLSERAGRFVLELTEAPKAAALAALQKEGIDAVLLGTTSADARFLYGSESIDARAFERLYEERLESVFPMRVPAVQEPIETFSHSVKTHPKAIKAYAKPRVLIPVFPGTNCEYDSARAFTDAGAEASILVLNNLSAAGIAEAVERFSREMDNAQIVFLPGGFSGGDEPDGSGKFITAFLRNARIRDGVSALLERRDGLMCGICNGFQALIKLGLVPYGRIVDPDPSSPTLTYNTIGRHQSRIVRTRIASNKSPWLALREVGDVVSAPVSHGEGRFAADPALIRTLAENGQIATQYADEKGNASMDIADNPNGSAYAIEGITSPDGRVFGKMGHSERIGEGLYKNVPGDYDLRMFEAAVRYYR